jgi:hypothetical protein
MRQLVFTFFAFILLFSLFIDKKDNTSKNEEVNYINYNLNIKPMPFIYFNTDTFCLFSKTQENNISTLYFITEDYFYFSDLAL